MDADVLNVIGEHFLAGHQRTDAASAFVRHAYGIREVFSNAPLSIEDACPFAPRRSYFTNVAADCRVQAVFCAPIFNGMIMFDHRIAEQKKRAWDDPAVIRVIEQAVEYWNHFDASEAMRESLDPVTREALADPRLAGFFDFITNLWQGHATIDFRRLLRGGYVDFRRQAADGRAAPLMSQDRKDFPAGLGVALDGIEILIRRNIAELAGRAAAASGAARARLERMRAAFEQMLVGAPLDFYQALQFTHFFNAVDGFDNVGRIDQYLYPFYAADLGSGLIDAQTAEDWLLSLFGIWAANDLWNISIGGQDAAGASAVNGLTHLALNARGRLPHTRPSLSLRLPAHDGEELLAHAFEILKTGLGQPATTTSCTCVG